MASGEQRKIGFLGYLLRLTNWIIIFGLLGSYLAQWISPQLFWPMAFLGIAFPILFILNIAFLFHWIFRKRRFLIYSLIAVLLGLPMVGRFFQLGSNTEIMDTKSTLKIVSYNVHVFDYYQNKYGTGNYARNEILKLLKNENAEVYCLQEFATRSATKKDNIKYIQQQLGTPYVSWSGYYKKSEYLINIIFSKYPIKDKGAVKSPSEDAGTSAVFADIEVNNEIYRIYSTHLQSIQISNEKKIIEMNFNLNTESGQQDAKDNSIRFIKKIKNAFAARSRQIAVLKNHLASSQYPIIIAGDFNDTPSSYAYGQLTSNLDDAFIKKGKGFGKTYIGPYPSFRIDYILFDPQFTCIKYNTIKNKLSDHYAISANFNMD